MPDGPNTPAAVLITIAGLVVTLVGYLWPVRGYLRRAAMAGALRSVDEREVLRRMIFGAALAGVALLGTWGAIQWAPRWAFELEPDPARHAKEYTQICSGLGAIVATILAALAAGRFGRRVTYTVLCLGSIAAALLLYQGNTEFGPFFLFCSFLAGGVTAAFYGWFPLYLPELFPTAVRATGQGFSYNFGRILAAIGGLQTATLMTLFSTAVEQDGKTVELPNFPQAGSVLTVIYLIGVFVIWLGPETKGKPLPE
jgi:hypothetical protein